MRRIGFFMAIAAWIGTPVWAAPPKKPAKAATVASPAESEEDSLLEPKSKSRRRVHAGLGVMTQNLFGKTSTDVSGASNSLGTHYLGLHAQAHLGGGDWLFAPTLNVTPLGLEDSDSGSTRRVLSLGLMGVKRWSPWDIRLGPGLYFYQINGSGGRVTLNNGNSTQTFFRPGDTSTAFQFSAIAGIGREINPDFRVDWDFAVTGLAGERRALTSMLFLSYGVF